MARERKLGQQAAQPARYGAKRKARVASGSATAQLHHHLGHDQVQLNPGGVVEAGRTVIYPAQAPQ